MALCVGNVSTAQVYQQLMQDNSVNFYTAVDSANEYFSTIDKAAKGSGYKSFQRWKCQNESKYAPDGARNLVSPYFAQEEYQKFLRTQRNTRALTSKWREIGPNKIDTITGHYAVGLGRIEDIYVHKANPNIIYTGSRSGGFWKSTNGGTSWQGMLTDSLFASGCNAIAVSPTNADSILINVRNGLNGTSHGIYRSVNGGTTWSLSNFSPAGIGTGGLGTNFQIYRVAYHPTIPNLIFIGTNQGLYRSTDNLATWTQPYTTGQITQIEFHPTNPNIVYLYDNISGGANENKVLRSYNAGASFSASATVPGNGNSTMFLAVSDACASCLYVGSNGGVWRTRDSAQTFTTLSSPGVSIRAFSVNTYDTTKIVAGYVDLSRSTNSGQAFSQCSWWSLGSTQHNGTDNASSFVNSAAYIHADANIMRCINGVHYVGTDGFVAKSTDDGATWTRLAQGLGIREYYCIGTSQSNHYVTMCGSQDNGESIAKQKGWLEFYGADGMEGITLPLNQNWLMGSVQYGNRRRTKDGGLTQDSGGPNVTDGAWVAPLAYDPMQHMRLYDFTDSVYRSEDFGTTWTYAGKPSFGNAVINSAALAENNANAIVCSSNSLIQKSTDGGASWTNIKNNLPTYTITDIAFDPKDDNTIAVTYNRYQADNQKIYITRNGGTTWTNITHNLGNMPLHSVVIDHTPQQNIYVGAEIGVYVKAMADTVWTLFQNGLPNVSVKELEICYGSNTLKAATWGRGLWECPLRNRTDYPAIVFTNITNPPTSELPRVGSDQFVTSSIHYTGTLSKVYVLYGENTTVLSNKLDMALISDSTWRTQGVLPHSTPNAIVYFKVIAVGAAGDTSETYRFNYIVRPREFCTAAGSDDGSNLHISNVTVDAVNNNTINGTYTYYNNPVLQLQPNTTYTISVTGSTNWGENDYGAWIDFSNDAYFDPVTEVIMFDPNSGQTGTGTFTLPATYWGLDTVRMRVRLGYWGANPSPCDTTLGEVEDYAVKLNYPTSISNSPASGIRVMPNPAHDKLFIDLPSSEANVYKIYTVSGTVVSNGNYHAGKDKYISISNLPPGLYYLVVAGRSAKFSKN
jgi:photosystem II stability/assembly factor-like uncharacterized protein